jgi:hypothetical protein
MGSIRDTLSLAASYGPFALRKLPATLGIRRTPSSDIR